MFVKNLFQRNKTVTAEFRNRIETLISGSYSYTYPVDPTLSIEGLVWTGRAAERVVSDRFRVDLEAILVVDPSDYTIIINENSKVTINGQDYSTIYIDNIASQDQVMQIPLKRFKAN